VLKLCKPETVSNKKSSNESLSMNQKEIDGNALSFLFVDDEYDLFANHENDNGLHATNNTTFANYISESEDDSLFGKHTCNGGSKSNINLQQDNRSSLLLKKQSSNRQNPADFDTFGGAFVFDKTDLHSDDQNDFGNNDDFGNDDFGDDDHQANYFSPEKNDENNKNNVSPTSEKISSSPITSASKKRARRTYKIVDIDGKTKLSSSTIQMWINNSQPTLKKRLLKKYYVKKKLLNIDAGKLK
jgi:hypothetical protein